MINWLISPPNVIESLYLLLCSCLSRQRCCISSIGTLNNRAYFCASATIFLCIEMPWRICVQSICLKAVSFREIMNVRLLDSGWFQLLEILLMNFQFFLCFSFSVSWDNQLDRIVKQYADLRLLYGDFYREFVCIQVISSD